MGDLAGILLFTGDEVGPFVLGAAAFLPLALITLSDTFRLAAGQRGRVRLELGTSRVVGKQGERDKTNVSAQHTAH
jgi:hypothetical protein